jgi:2-polyprenyl-3-methyl-5-hydroxy-6-metoxy-1,4-benzoquinol methylase
MLSEKYNMKYVVAVVRGYLKRAGIDKSGLNELICKPLDDLTAEEQLKLIEIGKNLNIKLHYFKKTDRELPRVNKVLGFLKGIYFESLLDVGSGRGVFLLPFLEEFPFVKVKSVDILDKRVQLLSDLASGGIENLSVEKADICEQPYADNSVDVVTMLEVLEHIPNVQEAIAAAVKIAKSYVVLTVPSKEDDNPEHIHLLTKEKLSEYFGACGVKRLTFDGVPGHLFMIARLEK